MGCFGVLHAVAVAPSVIVPSTWLPIVLPERHGRSVELLLRCTTRSSTLSITAKATSHPTTTSRRVSDLLMATPLPPRSTRSRSVTPIGGPLPPLSHTWPSVATSSLPTRSRFDATPDTKDVIRRYLAATVVTAHKTFVEARRASLAQQHHAPAHSPRIGRNDPCPCGSGKKFKRCCIDRPRQVNSN